jgi:hypothetical protein
LYPCPSLRGNARRDPCGRYAAPSSSFCRSHLSTGGIPPESKGVKVEPGAVSLSAIVKYYLDASLQFRR